CVILLTMSSVPGCGSDDLTSPTAAKLRGVANLYLDYVVTKNGKGPGSEQDFKKHLRNLHESVLKDNGVDPKSIDSPIISERDQEPIVILYGLTITKIGANSTQVIAHEKTGKRGKRLAVLASTKVEAVDEARLQELMSTKQ